MQRLEVSGAVRPIYGSLGVKRLNTLGWYKHSWYKSGNLESMLDILLKWTIMK